MVQELQNHGDWYEPEESPTPRHIQMDPMLPRRLNSNRLVVDRDGFITVPTQRRSPSVMAETDVTPIAPNLSTNRYQVLLLDEALETLTEHAKQLETTAISNHTDRLEDSRQQLKTAMDEALDQIQKVTAAQCEDKKRQIDNHCETQFEALISDLDNFSGRAQRIQEEILNGVRDGATAAKTVPIDDDDDHIPPAAQTPAPPSTAGPNPSPTDNGTQSGDDDVSDHVPIQRWARVDYEAIRQNRHTPPPMESPMKPTPSPYTDDRHEHLLSRLRSTNLSIQLRTKDRKAIIRFYNGFVDFLQQFQVPITSFDQIRIEHLENPLTTVYPPSITTESPLYSKYSAAIYAKLEEDGVLDSSDPLYCGLLQMYNRTRDGYAMLKSLLAATLLVEAKNLSQWSTPPPVEPNCNPFEYAAQLQEFYQFQMTFQRHYTDREQATMYLQGMQQVRAYATAATQLMHDLEQLPSTSTLTHRFVFSQLPITLNMHPATLPTSSTASNYATAHLNLTRAQPTAYKPRHPTAPTTTSMPRTVPPRNRGRSGLPGRKPPKDIQCHACATYGHEIADCNVLPKIAACIDYIQANSTMAQTILQRYKQANHPTNRQSRQNTREVVANKLQGHLSDSPDLDFDDLVDDITDSLYDNGYDDDGYMDENGASIFSMHATPPIRITNEEQDGRPPDAIHPVKFPLLAQIHDAAPDDLHHIAANPTIGSPALYRETMTTLHSQRRLE
jgi:hypothetical protein